MAEVVRLARAEAEAPAAEPDWFVETEAAGRILRTLDALKPGQVTMIAGAPGTGKTATVRRFLEGNETGYYHEAVAGEASAWNVARSILSAYYGPNSRFGSSILDLREPLTRIVRECGWLIVDEAQDLDRRDRKSGVQGEALGWLQAVAADAMARLVFVGGLSLPEAVARWDRLAGKLRCPVVLDKPPVADVAAYLLHRGYRDDAVTAALAAAAARTGGLRNVRNVLDQAERFAGKGAASRAHVQAALWQELRMEMPE
jgi:hypothetical protein